MVFTNVVFFYDQDNRIHVHTGRFVLQKQNYFVWVFVSFLGFMLNSVHDPIDARNLIFLVNTPRWFCTRYIFLNKNLIISNSFGKKRQVNKNVDDVDVYFKYQPAEWLIQCYDRRELNCRRILLYIYLILPFII